MYDGRSVFTSKQTMIEQTLYTAIEQAIKQLFSAQNLTIQFQKTRKEFEGDITLVVFPLLKASKKSPEQTAQLIGDYLIETCPIVSNFNIVKGFLNLTISDDYWLSCFQTASQQINFGKVEISENAPTYLVEFSSPNTNKPLHLGHIRNILLGHSVSQILQFSGKRVKKVQIINDRGIHICKSMIAWLEYGKGETPISTQMKGDHFVGKYYVIFDQHYKSQQEQLILKGLTKADAEKQAPLFKKAQDLLIKWEAKDAETIALWQKMNGWVYDGFESTYRRMGVDFDKNYYESDTYLLGKEVIEVGLQKGIFYKKEDSSVWIDLTAEGLDHKILLRSDGTAVYMTQDIGTAIQRHEDFMFSHMAYTVGNEQDYHFKVLFIILKKLGYKWAENCYHLSYGMVDLPTGKMKSREGTVVDADELMVEMTDTARTLSQELGKLDGYSNEEKEGLYKTIGLGALKYYILKVDPRKRILFDPKESVDFQGNTGPFIQYTYARIQSILRKATFDYSQPITDIELHEKEKELIKIIENYPEIIQQAAANHSPALIANYTYDLVKEFNSFYQNVSILGEENQHKKIIRVQLSKKVSDIIKSAFSLLGIEVPERM